MRIPKDLYYREILRGIFTLKLKLNVNLPKTLCFVVLAA